MTILPVLDRKAIVKRSKLKNKFLKTRKGESKECFNRQINSYVGLLRKNKRLFFWILDHRVY